jgi:hypothetical protein
MFSCLGNPLEENLCILFQLDLAVAEGSGDTKTSNAPAVPHNEPHPLLHPKTGDLRALYRTDITLGRAGEKSKEAQDETARPSMVVKVVAAEL